MSNVDLFVYGVLLKDGHFTCIFAVVQYPIRLLGKLNYKKGDRPPSKFKE